MSDKVERFEPYEHPELGAQMRPCQTLGGYVKLPDYEEVRDERDQGVRFVEGWQERAKELEDEMGALKTNNFLHCKLANAGKPSEVAAILAEALKADGDGC